MLNHGTGSVLALCLAVAGGFAMPVNVDATPHTTVVTSHTYASGDPAAGSILDWIAARSPDRRPLARNGVVSVERMQHFRGLSARSSDSPTPPGGLPDKGSPGEEYNVENNLPDGTAQTWSYRWVEPSTGHGGGWDLVGYSFRKGNDPVDIQ
jgi:hypothetical protein